MREPRQLDENADYCAQFKCFQPEPEAEPDDFEEDEREPDEKPIIHTLRP